MGYANFTLNAYTNKANRNKIRAEQRQYLREGKKMGKTFPLEQSGAAYSLKSVWNKLNNMKWPIKINNIEIKSIEVCSNNRGCSPRTVHNKSDYLVRYKDNETEQLGLKKKMGNSDKDFVVIFINGTYEINGVKCNCHMRVPRSGVIGVKIGLSKQNDILVNQEGDTKLKLLGLEIEKDVFKLFSGEIKKIRELEMSNATIFGLNVFNPKTGERPDNRIASFDDVIESIDNELELHELDYVPTNARSVVRGNFKSEDPNVPSIGLTQWGMVDFVKVKKISSVIKLAKELVDIVRKLTIEFEVAKKPKLKTMCSNRNPQPDVNGSCTNGGIALPNKKGGLCCYKKRLSNQKIRDLYAKYGMNIPIALQNRLQNIQPSNKSYLNVNIPKYNAKIKKFIFKGVPFDRNSCVKLSKTDIIEFAKVLEVNPKGKRDLICKRIFVKLAKDKDSIIKRFQRISRKLKMLTVHN